MNRSIYVIPRTRNGASKRTRNSLGILEFDQFVKKTYSEFVSGLSIKDIFEKYNIVRRQEKEYERRLINMYLHQGDNTDLDLMTLVANLKTSKDIDLGFLYIIEVNDKIKFGKTKDLKRRLATYKSHSGVFPKIIDFWFGVGYSDFENDMKKVMRGKGITEEWFEGRHKEEIENNFRKLLTSTL